jgi:hypothetical protein
MHFSRTLLVSLVNCGSGSSVVGIKWSRSSTSFRNRRRHHAQVKGILQRTLKLTDDGIECQSLLGILVDERDCKS